MTVELERFVRKLLPSIRKLADSGWSIAPGNSVSASAPVWKAISAGGEGGDFTASHFNRTQKYRFKYAIGGVGAGRSSSKLPDAQWFPSSFPSGNVGRVLRIPPYSPPALSASGGSYEDGPPTGFAGGAMIMAGGAVFGVPTASIGIMFMGHVEPAKSLEAAVKRFALDTGLSAFGPLGRFARIVKDFKYATTVWCTGVSTPQFSGGISMRFGQVWR
jgi:hypothetical protein